MEQENGYIKNLKNDIIDIYVFVRKNDCSIPSESLDFMENAALAAVDKINPPCFELRSQNIDNRVDEVGAILNTQLDEINELLE